MYYMIINSLLLILIFIVISSVNAEYVIETKLGKVSGLEVNSILKNKKFYSFLSIPYAVPPVGELRFMPPKSHSGWTDILNATKERSACPQYYLPIRHVANYGYYGDEDCLHLSIHTPILPSKEEKPQLPVIVFVFNDQFKMSYNATKEYSPDFFMEQNVIIVTIHHRLASLGFISFQDDLLPGNNGLRDIILALTWIKENIDNFGGNSNSVTLMGSQAGAVAVDMLLHSKKAKGLFHRVILQSGTSWNSMYFPGNARKRAIKLSEILEWGASTSQTLVKYLGRLTPSEILENEYQVVHADEARALQRGIPTFTPDIEHDHPDAVLSRRPEDGPIDIDIPVMIGYNSREGIELNERYLRKPQYLTFADRDFLFLFPIRTNYHFQINDNVYYEAIDEIKEFYFEEGYIKISKPGEYITYIGDALQFYSIDYTVRKYANESKASVYYYTFDYSGDLNLRKKQNLKDALNLDGTWGATVTDELCYLFVCQPIRKTYIKALKDEDSEEIKVLRNMVHLWTNFAKSGNPTPSDSGLDVKWLPATTDEKHCLLINEDLEMKTNLHDGRVRFWDRFIKKYEERAIDGVVKDLKDEL